MPDASAKTRHAAAQSASTSAGAFPQNDKPTIISALAANPTLAPSIAAKQLFPLPSAAKRGILRFRIKEQLEEGRGKHWHWNKGATHANNAEPDDEELEATRIRYGYKTAAEGGPRRLYLMVSADITKLRSSRRPSSQASDDGKHGRRTPSGREDHGPDRACTRLNHSSGCAGALKDAPYREKVLGSGSEFQC